MWQAEYYFSEAQSQHSSHSLFQDINCSKLPEEKSFWARKSCSQGWREDKGMCVWEYFKQGGDKVFRGNSYLVCYHTGTLSLSWMCRPHSSLKSSALALSGKGFPLFFKCCVNFFYLFKCNVFSETFCDRLYFFQNDTAIFPVPHAFPEPCHSLVKRRNLFPTSLKLGMPL